MDMRIPPLQIHESNPPKSRILAGRLGLAVCRGTTSGAWPPAPCWRPAHYYHYYHYHYYHYYYHYYYYCYYYYYYYYCYYCALHNVMHANHSIEAGSPSRYRHGVEQGTLFYRGVEQ